MEKRANLSKIGRQYGIEGYTLSYRLKKGMTLEQAIALGPRLNNFISQCDAHGIKIKYPALRRYMKEHKLTKRDFAKQCGVSESTISAMLTGMSDPSKPVVDKILRATGMTYEEAFKEG